MRNEIEIFKNEELGELRTILNSDGSISVNAEDTARGFGWVDKSKFATSGESYIRWARINEYIKELGFSQHVGKDDYIPESLFYLLGMKANNDKAVEFQKWLAIKVIPSIRKHGLYLTDELLSNQELLDDKINELRYDCKRLKEEKEEIQEENLEYRKQRNVLFRLSIKTGEDESYLPGLVIQVIRSHINNNPDIIINERDEHIFIKRTPLYKELRKLIIRDRDILEVLYSMGMNIQDRIVIVPTKFMANDYEPIGNLY